MTRKSTTPKPVKQEVESTEKKINALQAGKIIGLHERYNLHLKKKYPGQLEGVIVWVDIFLAEGLIEEKPKFLV